MPTTTGRSRTRTTTPPRTATVRPQARPAAAPAVRTHLPASGPGFRTYGPRSMQWGTEATVGSMQRIAQRYHAATGRTLEVGDLSQQGGGRTSRHKSHLRGTDVDLRPPSSSGGPATWRSAGYDRAATRRLIQEIRRENPNARILFNDPVLIREGLTRPAAGHDNHLHVSFR